MATPSTSCDEGELKFLKTLVYSYFILLVLAGYSDLRLNVQSLEDEFNEFVIEFVDYLEKNDTSIRYLSRYIQILPGYVGASITPLWKRLKPELENIKEISEFLALLNSNLWNFLDYQMLEHLIKKCDATQLMTRMRAYIAKINQFKEVTLVIPFIKCWDGHKMDNIPDSVVKVIVKCEFKSDVTKFTLANLDDLRQKILRKCHPLLSHFASIMYYHKIKIGSLCISWFFPARFSHILQNGIQNVSKILEKYHIIWVKLNNDYIYSEDCSSKLCKFII